VERGCGPLGIPPFALDAMRRRDMKPRIKIQTNQSKEMLDKELRCNQCLKIIGPSYWWVPSYSEAVGILSGADVRFCSDECMDAFDENKD
jgi:hypothetical protein